MKKRGSMLVFIAIIVIVISLFVFFMMPKIAETLASGKFALRIAAARDIAMILDTIYAYPYDMVLEYDVDLSGLEVKIFQKMVTIQEKDLDPLSAEYPFVPANDDPNILLRSPKKIFFSKTNGKLATTITEPPPPSSSRAPCNKLAFGVGGHAEQDAKFKEIRDKIKQIGIATIGWKGIEPTKGGGYVFSTPDNDINKMITDGLEPSIIFCDGDCFPDWARVTNTIDEINRRGYCCAGTASDPQTYGYRIQVCTNAKSDDDTKQAFSRAVAAMVNQYKDRVKYWAFGIEPNCRGETPEFYTIWLKLFSDAVRSVKSDAVIVAPHLSGTDEPYLSRMYASGAKNYFDVVAIDPYGRVGESLDYSGISIIRNVLASNSDSSKKIWVTEWGVSSKDIGEERQKELIREGLNYLSTSPWIFAANYHGFECELDVPFNECTPGVTRNGINRYLGFSILRSDGTEKPSFGEFKTLAENCKPPTPPPGGVGPPPGGIPPPIVGGGASKLGLHTSFRNGDEMKIINDKKPSVVKILAMDSSSDAKVFEKASDINRESPSTYIIGRIVESEDLQKRDGDPIVIAQEWFNRNKNAIGSYPAVDCWEGYNELAINSQDEMKGQDEMKWYSAFEVERIRLLKSLLNANACIGSFAAGSPGKMELWEYFYPALRAARDNGGVLALHEYGAPNKIKCGFNDAIGEGFFMGRYRKVHNSFPDDLKGLEIVITETGVDGGVCADPSCECYNCLIEGDKEDLCGWKGRTKVSKSQYINDLQWYNSIISQDTYVKGAVVYQTGIMGWESFETPGDIIYPVQQT